MIVSANDNEQNKGQHRSVLTDSAIGKLVLSDDVKHQWSRLVSTDCQYHTVMFALSVIPMFSYYSDLLLNLDNFDWLFEPGATARIDLRGSFAYSRLWLVVDEIWSLTLTTRSFTYTSTALNIELHCSRSAQQQTNKNRHTHWCFFQTGKRKSF